MVLDPFGCSAAMQCNKEVEMGPSTRRLIVRLHKQSTLFLHHPWIPKFTYGLSTNRFRISTLHRISKDSL